MPQTTSYRVQRALTAAEMTPVLAAVSAAATTTAILHAVISAVFTALLAPLGESPEDFTATRQLNPSDYAIPATQWEAISEAATARADAFGGRMQLAMELVNLMPASYEDPAAAVPASPPAATHELLPHDPDERLDRSRSDPRTYAAREILTTILTRDTTSRSATETIRETLTQSTSLATLAPLFQHALETAIRPAYKQILRDRYGPRADTITQTPGYPQLRRLLLAGEQAGYHPARLLTRAAATTSPTAYTNEQLIERLTSRISAYLTKPGHTPLPGPVPAWLVIPPSARQAISTDIPPYLVRCPPMSTGLATVVGSDRTPARYVDTALADLQQAITTRVAALTETAISARPAWVQALGGPPVHAAGHATWASCLATIAAWRDQHNITHDSTQHILGLWPSPASNDEPAWQHATTAITTARIISRTHQPRAARGQHQNPIPSSTLPPRHATNYEMPLLQQPQQSHQSRQISL